MSKKKPTVCFDGVDMTPPESENRRIRPTATRNGNQPWDASLQIPVRMNDAEVMTMDEEEWAVPSFNKKGQSVRVNVKIFPEMENLCKLLVERGGFPYTTSEDLFRHAIYRHVVWLNEIRTIKPPTAFVACRAVQAMMQQEMLKDEIEIAVEPHAKRLQEALAKGYMATAIRLLDRLMGYVNELEKGPERDRFEKSIEIHAGRVIQEINDRRILIEAKITERAANAVLSDAQDSTHFSEEEPTEYPVTPAPEEDSSPLAKLENRMLADLFEDERRASFNPPDEDDYYNPVDIIVDTETGEEL